MTAVQDIKDMQWNWASTKGILFDSRGYERGAGAELRGNTRALHSSPDLVVNVYDHWTDRDRSPVLSALIDERNRHS